MSLCKSCFNSFGAGWRCEICDYMVDLKELGVFH